MIYLFSINCSWLILLHPLKIFVPFFCQPWIFDQTRLDMNTFFMPLQFNWYVRLVPLFLVSRWGASIFIQSVVGDRMKPCDMYRITCSVVRRRCLFDAAAVIGRKRSCSSYKFCAGDSHLCFFFLFLIAFVLSSSHICNS